MIGDRIEIRLPRRASFLGTIRRFFRALVREVPGIRLEEREVAEIQLVLQEACINAIRHADPERPGTSMAVVFLLHPDRLTIEIHDQGPGFDPDAVPEPDAEGLQEGGYGVFIMKRSMDRVEARREGETFVLSATRIYRTADSSVEAASG